MAGKVVLQPDLAVYSPTAGRIYSRSGHHRGARIRYPKLGIARPSNIELFENATCSAISWSGSTDIHPQLCRNAVFPSVRSTEKVHRRRVQRVIEFLDLCAYRTS